MSLRPLAEFSADVCAGLRGIVFDIDDTITDGGRVTSDAFAALWQLHEAGLLLVAVTGRPLGWCDVVARLWPVTVAVGENGAGWVWREGARLRDGFWDDAAERAEQQIRAAALVAAIRGRFPEVSLAGDQRLRRVDVAFDVGETQTLPEPTVRALVAAAQEHGARALVSSVHVHVFFGDHDKATGVVRAVADATADRVDDAPERWLFVGDSGNDAAAFAHFPISVGVANVREHLHRLPTPPAYIARADRAGGFAELAAHVLARR